MRTAAIIVAGGSGSRMGTSQPKQFLDLGGKPLLAHTLSRFEECERVDEIVVVLPRKGFEAHARIVSGWVANRKPVTLAPGGEERQDSVAAGLDKLPDRYDGLVAVHDGARPLVEDRIIRDAIETAARFGAAVVAVPVYETLKEVENGIVVGTVERTRFYRAQTPQCFRCEILRPAMARARAEGYLGTDEAALVERMNIAVHVVAGSETNIKVTTKSDLALAEYYLRRQVEGVAP